MDQSVMKAVVFTPTNRLGGLDVLENSLMRQTFRNFVWVVSDQHYHDRIDTWQEIRERVDFPILHLNLPIKKKNKRNLCLVYNRTADYATEDAFTFFVSLQDYIYLPENGLERFGHFCLHNPNDLITGVTHISRDPFPNKIHDISGKYTIFKEPYGDKPKRTSWEDVRVTEIYHTLDQTDPYTVELNHWETNWAAVPVKLLEKGARWNEEYDVGVAYENMDFARRCNKEFGSEVFLDPMNIAISLPHKDYFEGEREEIEQYSNREKFEKEWYV